MSVALALIGSMFVPMAGPVAPGTVAVAQDLGSIWGTVYDGRCYEDDHCGANAAVVAVLEAGTATVITSAITDSDGEYWTDEFAAGTYDLQVTHVGHETVLLPGVEIVGATEADAIEMTPLWAYVYGIVYNAGTNDPVEDSATVQILEAGTSNVAQIEWTYDGNFWTNEFPAGTYDVLFTGDGYEPLLVSGLVLVGHTPLGTFEMTPLWGSIEGSVVFSGSSDGVVGATVSVLAAGTTDVLHTTLTNDGGSYTTSHFDTGTYDVSVEYDGYQRVLIEGVQVAGYTRIGQTVIEPFPGVTISGQVVDDSGNPVVDAGLRVERADTGELVAYPRTDELGQYVSEEFPVGIYDIEVRANDHETTFIPSVVIDEPVVLDPIVLTPIPQGSIEGFVVDEAGQPIVNARVAVHFPGSTGKPRTTAYTDDTGWYRTRTFDAGTYDVRVTTTGYETIFNPSLLIDGLLVLDPIVARHVWTIAAQVNDELGRPVERATVSFREVGTTNVVVSGTSGPAGDADLESVPSGAYDVWVAAGGFESQTMANVVIGEEPIPLNFVLMASGPEIPLLYFSNYVGGRYPGDQVCSDDGLGGFACTDINRHDATQGLAVGDLDNDGDIDAVFATDHGISRVCLRGPAGGYTCTDMPGDHLDFGVALGDADGDGDLDAFFASLGSRNRVCLNDGTGGFAACSDVSPEPDETFEVAVGDVNGDGSLDVVFANERDNHQVCLGSTTGEFACTSLQIAGNTFSDVALGDVDNDGNLDALFSDSPGGAVCLGDGLGGFDCIGSIDAENQGGRSVMLGDLNADGMLDAVLLSRVCLGDGAGGFSCTNLDVASPRLNDVEIADLNLDGHLDVAFSDYEAPNPVCFGDGTGGFSSCVTVGTAEDETTGVAVADNARPHMYIDVLDDIVMLEAWPSGPDITFEVFDSDAPDAALLYAETIGAAGSSPLNEYETDLGGIDVLAGHHVVASNGDVEVAHTVTTLSISSFDFDGDSFTGTASADIGSVTIARAGVAGGELVESGPLAGTVWTAEFAGSVEFGLFNRIEGSVTEFDADQNATFFTFVAEYEPLEVQPGETSVTTDDDSITIEGLEEGETLEITTGPPSASTEGVEFLGQTIDIESAATGTTVEPLVIILRVPVDENPTGVDPDDIVVFKDGGIVENCVAPLDEVVNPACVLERFLDPGTGDIEITVQTLSFSVWTMAFPSVTIDDFSADSDPLEIGAAVSATGTLADAGKTQATGVTAAIAWDDGSCEIVEIVDGTVQASHDYAEVGVFSPTLRVYAGAVENCGVAASLEAIDEATYDYVVLYDPAGGFVTGGGWIDSPVGAYLADPSLTGKATFGFVSKYKKGASIPTGNTDFHFKTAGLNFHSSSYDWLVVTGSDFAKFKGEGTINGEGDYRFQIWAGDASPDTFRIKIWTDVAGVESAVYDNGMNQPIGAGSIIVHTKK